MQAITELFVLILTFFLMFYDIMAPLFVAIPLLAVILSVIAVVRRVKDKKPSRVSVVFLSLGGLFALLSAFMFLLSEFDLSLYLFGAGSSTLCLVTVGLAALCLVIGMLLLMKGVIRKHLVAILAVLLALWLLVLDSNLYFYNLASTYERIDHDTVVETEDVLGHITVTEYEIVFPGLMKKVEVTYQ